MSGKSRDKGIEITEAQFQETVIELAQKSGFKVYHTHDSRKSEPGFPDLVLVRPPRCLFVECKREDGKLTPEQGEWLMALAGCQSLAVFVWRPTEWGEIESVIAGGMSQHQGDHCR